MFSGPNRAHAVRFHLMAFALLLTVTLGGCQRVPFAYAPEVQQGNLVSAEMIERLEPGMTQRDALFVLGSPMLRHGREADRWDYVHATSRGGGGPYQRLTLVFDAEGRLSALEGDLAPQPWPRSPR
jgi:outer membrane protein assembly factor BamE